MKQFATTKLIRPQREELLHNRRARSAKLRVANALLILVITAMAGVYLVRSNMLVSHSFVLGAQRIRVRALSAQVAAAENVSTAQIEQLQSMAQRLGLVPGREGQTLVAGSNVAFQPH